MATPSKYAVALDTLESVRVPPDKQIEEQDVHTDAEYVTAEELDRARLLSPSGAGKLHVR